MSAFLDLLGNSLRTKDGKTIKTADALTGKRAVALYFSAHWCPPCRGFTPKLAEFYNAKLKDLGLEVVFVSSDRDEAAFTEYANEQPWLALPYDKRDLKTCLSKRFKVSGIPTLVILDGTTGEVVTKDGREAVSEDPTGVNFPWKPPTFWEALGDTFLKGTDGETVEVEELKGEGKVIGLYFSAHWCPPCRAFTPQLVKSYTEHLKAKNLEIIFVSSDRDSKAFQEYFATMPWLAIPNGDPRKAKLSKIFDVSGIPSFVLVDAATGATINANARGKISSDPTGAEFPYHPKAFGDLEDPDGINDELSLCVMLEGCDEATTSAAVAALESVAAASKAAKEDTNFYVAEKAGDLATRIRDMTELGKAGATPQMLLMDIPDEGGYYVSDAKEVTKETIAAFIDAYKAKSLTRQQLA
jgi:nucleoredoxin